MEEPFPPSCNIAFNFVSRPTPARAPASFLPSVRLLTNSFPHRSDGIVKSPFISR